MTSNWIDYDEQDGSELCLTELNLYGRVAEIVGASKISLAVNTVSEAIRAIGAQFPGLADVVESCDWEVVNGDLETGARLLIDELDVIAAREIHFIPATAGGSGAGMVIAGAALITASFFLPGSLMFLAPAMMGAGAGMMVGGLAQTLVKNPKTSTTSSADTASSFIFGDSSGTIQQGKNIPVTYGEDIVEPLTVSVSISAEDYAEDSDGNPIYSAESGLKNP